MCEVNSIQRYCGPSPAGLTRMYVCDVNDVVRIPSANEDWIIEDDIVLKDDAYFKTIAFREQAAGLSDELADAVGGGFTKNLGLKIMRYGSASNKWIYDMVGTRFIMLLEDFTQQVILVGDLARPMRMEKAAGNTGEKLGDENAWAVTLAANTTKPCYMYQGYIKTGTAPAPVSGATGRFLKLRVNLTGSGVIDPTFDGYVQAGMTIYVPALNGRRLIKAIVNAQIYQDFSIGADGRISQSGATIDFSAIGGVHNNDWIILCYN